MIVVGFIVLATDLIAPIEAAPVTQNTIGTGISDSCTPLDTVVIIDQSNSMRTNDPQALRIDAVGNLIDILYENAALRCPGVAHRIGVVGFGSEAEILLNFEEGVIRVEDADDDWATARNALKSRVASDELGLTAFLPAFVSAQALFDSVPPIESAGSSSRARAILLVTDGEPCTAVASNNTLENSVGYCQSPSYARHYFEANAGFDNNNYLEEGFETPTGLRNALNGLVTASTSVNVLMFNNSRSTWQEVNEGWTRITGEHHGIYVAPDDNRLRSPRQIATILDDIISPLIGSVRNVIPVTEVDGQCVGPFYLEPYLSSTTILSATRPADENLRVQIIDPNGNRIPSQDTTFNNMNIRYNSGDAIERYILLNPPPGEWRVIDPTGQDCEEVDAKYEAIEVNIDLTSAAPIVPNIVAPYTRDDGASTVRLSLTDSLGSPFSGIPNYPLELSGRVQFLNNTRPEVQGQLDALDNIQFIPAQNIPGVWESSPLPAPVQGNYQLTITAQAAAVNPTNATGTNEIFETTLQYTTASPVALGFRIITPDTGSIIPSNTIDNTTGAQTDLPFNVEVEFITQANQRQPIDTIFPDGVAGAMQAEMHGINGTRIQEHVITLSPSETNPNLLVGEFHTTDGLPDPEGEYEIAISVTLAGQAGYNHENYVLSETPQTVQFERRELEGVRLNTLVPQNGQSLMLNTIVNAAQVSEPIHVRTQLVNQNDQPLPASQVFSGDLGQLVQASLFNPNGDFVQSIWLTPSASSSSTFEGDFPPLTEGIGEPGMYTIDFTFGSDTIRPQYDVNEYTFLAPATQSVSFERLERRGIVPVALEVIDTVDMNNAAENPLRFPINSVDGEGQQTQNVIHVVAALADLDGVLLPDTELEALLIPNVTEVITAALVGLTESNIRETQALTRQSNGTFEGSLRANVAAIDPEGEYAVSFGINRAAFRQGGELAQYELVRDQTPPVYLDGYQQHGIRLLLNSMTGTNVTDNSEILRLPLYNTWWDAWNSTIAPVPFELVIADMASNETMRWETIIGSDVTPVLAPTNAVVTLEPDATPEAVASGSTSAALAIADVVNVTVQPLDSGNVVAITDLRQEELPNGIVIRGEIVGQAVDTAEYVLCYGIDNDNVNRVIYVNFSDISAAQRCVNFVRVIDSLLLNPDFWNVIKPVLLGIAIVYAVWFYMLNFGRFSMSGKMAVTRRSPEGELRDVISLGGLRFLRLSRKGKNTGVTIRRTQEVETTNSGKGAIGQAEVEDEKRSGRRYSVSGDGVAKVVVGANQDGGNIMLSVKWQ